MASPSICGAIIRRGCCARSCSCLLIANIVNLGADLGP
jgi:hypothetical protein